jgi:hypothetical protein
MRTLLACLLLLAAGAVPAATSEPALLTAPATWHSYDVLVDLRDLPRTYSCDDLWYKFHDLLLELGARAYMTITPYHCGVPGRGEARSPSVELQFQLPQPLEGTATRYAVISAVTRTLHLEPGSPRSFGEGDCELVRQLEESLFTVVPVQVMASAFNCTTAHRATTARESFALTFQAAIATPAVSPRAGTSAGTPHS